MTARYGVRWPDGSVTGGITDHYRLAAAYAKHRDNPAPGVVYQEGSQDIVAEAPPDEAVA